MMQTNKLAWQTFWVLISGFLVLFISASFIVNAYWRLAHSQLTPTRLTHNIVRIIKLAKLLPSDKVAAALKHIRHPGIRIHFSKIPPRGLLPVFDVNIKDIRKQIEKNPDNVRLTFPLGDNAFIHIRTHIVQPLSLKIQFAAALLVWLSALIMFCFFIVQRLSLPLSWFIRGAERFAKDINAAPIPEIGPKSTRAAFQAFNHMQSHLKQLLHDRTQMLAAISHDLRTPITRLKLRLENLDPNATTAKMTQDLDQMENMIHSILAFAQDEYQHEAVTQINLHALLQSICADMQDAKQAVTYQEFDPGVICSGQAMALRRAIENLIQNGIKYGKTVAVTLTQDATWASIRITDQGPGIATDKLEKVFQPFYRIDAARTAEQSGSGLGLATARDIIRRHGGEIKLHNIQPHGIAALIKLPLVS